MTYVPDPPDAGEEPEGLPEPVLVLGGELTLPEPLVRQVLLPLAWTVIISV